MENGHESPAPPVAPNATAEANGTPSPVPAASNPADDLTQMARDAHDATTEWPGPGDAAGAGT